ncbi:nonstructural protein [Blackfly microvirus SF02]|uniref:Nonstructural protein n=1 Tax=Blackfly microvirus SF02 TaxID=2576452 RepID=A0A4P8PJK8_9VIRU|nr:nonstructural protein [Blackfly microvirus SF02]
MKIYAVYDLMIGYFLLPFVAPDDNQVLASISQDISRQDNTNAIAYAPHQFQVWQFGEISEDGNINPRKELICDCSSLVRARRSTTEPTSAEAARTAGNSRETPAGHAGNTRANGTAVRESTEPNHP